MNTSQVDTAQDTNASPIDTAPFMRDMGRGYAEFDYAAAWREARPLWDELPLNVRDLFLRVREETRDIHQDSKLDLPWPHDGKLQEAFRGFDAETLAKAARIIHALGHWLPFDAEPTDRVLFQGAPPDGAHWKFQLYADQSLRARAGKPSRGREPRKPTQLEIRCRDLGVKAVAREGAPDVDFGPNDWRATATGWTVKLSFRKRSLTVPFWQDAAHERPPTAADVLSCLISDATSVKSARDFEDWAHDLGFDSDSRKAKKTYLQCERIAKGVRLLLGEEFDTFASAEH